MRPRVLVVHPDDPQPRIISQAAQCLLAGGVVAAPTDACYVLLCCIADTVALARIRSFRKLGDRHLFTLLCRNLADVGACGMLGDGHFRLVRSLIPGPYTFILTAQRALSRKLTDLRRKTIGVRVPSNPIARALMEKVGQPLVCTSLITPDDDLPLTEPDEIAARLNGTVELVLDGGSGSPEVTTVIDLSGDEIQLVRLGLGSVDPLGFAS